MDETYIKVKGKWVYYYRAVDKLGKVIDYYLSPNRDEPAAKAFLNKAIAQNGLPSKVVIDEGNSNYAAIDFMNVQLWLTGYFMLSLVEILDIKYLNNIVPLGEAKNASSIGLEVNGRSLGKFAWTRNVDDVETRADRKSNRAIRPRNTNWSLQPCQSVTSFERC